MSSDPIGALNCMNLGVLDGTGNPAVDKKCLLIEGGPSLWMWNAPAGSGYAGQMVAIEQDITIDLTAIGANGMDVNPNSAGHMPPDGAYDLHAFLMPGATTPIFVVSKQGATEDVQFSGYAAYRKIPIFIPVLGGVLAPTGISGWPHPTTTYTNNTLVTELRNIPPAGLGSLAAPYAIDISTYVGENCRQGAFGVVITNGTATVYLGCGRNSDNPPQQFMKMCAFAEAGAKPYCKTRFMQQTLYVVVIPITGNPEIDIYIVDVDQIEAS